MFHVCLFSFALLICIANIGAPDAVVLNIMRYVPVDYRHSDD